MAALAHSDDTPGVLDVHSLLRTIRNGLIVVVALSLIVVILTAFLRPLIASVKVDESVTTTLAQLVILVLPYIAYIAAGSAVRDQLSDHPLRAVLTALLATLVLFVVISIGHFVFHLGPFVPTSSLEMTFTEAEGGALVESLVPGGVAEEAGVQVGDLITAVRRDPVTSGTLSALIARSAEDSPFRLRIVRGGEETQLTVRTVLAGNDDLGKLLPGLVVALIVTAVAIFWPGQWTPYVILLAILLPLLIGYFWLIIATFSYRTEGLIPLDGQGNVGGWTLNNWNFLFGADISGLNVSIWQITLNSLIIAVAMMVIVLLVSSMAGYALSRMNFAGRRAFLSFTLVLHGFPAVTLLIPIFFVMSYLGKVPLVGEFIGFNKPVGISLVMVAFELPLGVWLMKGFFDNIPWDIERSALIDGASRWRTYWEILLPQIRPGILALGIFAFIGGWNAFLIPQTYSTGAGTINLPVFLRQLINETAPVNWNQVAAVGMFQLIPVFIIFIFAQEYLLNIYAGGTKGSS
ncbi:MAG: ABC transporter permease subunit [Anaerolineae bacterium]|nr:ABC transporter permease subunit [Anaerolineae bacterium]